MDESHAWVEYGHKDEWWLIPDYALAFGDVNRTEGAM